LSRMGLRSDGDAHRWASVRNSTAPHLTHRAIETPAMLLERSTSHPGLVHPGRCVVVVGLSVVIVMSPSRRSDPSVFVMTCR